MSTEEQLARELPSVMIEREREIFSQWRDCQTSFAFDGQFIEDGIVHFPTYEGTFPKLLFLLKEPNDKPPKDKSGELLKRENWNLAVWLGKGAPQDDPTKGYKTWEVIARWVHDITTENGSTLSWKDLENAIGQNSVHEREVELRKIAVVNIKKSGGGGSTQMKLLYPEIENMD